MSSTPKVVPMEVLQAEREILRLMRIADKSAGVRQRDVSLHNMKHDILCREIPRGFTVRNLLLFFHDLCQREAGSADIDAIPAALGLAFRQWKKEEPVRDFDSEHVQEETDEAACDVAEAIVRRDKTGSALQVMQRAYRKHDASRRRSLEAAHTLVYGSPTNPRIA